MKTRIKNLEFIAFSEGTLFLNKTPLGDWHLKAGSDTNEYRIFDDITEEIKELNGEIKRKIEILEFLKKAEVLNCPSMECPDCVGFGTIKDGGTFSQAIRCEKCKGTGRILKQYKHEKSVYTN